MKNEKKFNIHFGDKRGQNDHILLCLALNCVQQINVSSTLLCLGKHAALTEHLSIKLKSRLMSSCSYKFDLDKIKMSKY